MSNNKFTAALDRFDAASRNCAGDTQASAPGEVSDVTAEYLAARSDLLSRHDALVASLKDARSMLQHVEVENGHPGDPWSSALNRIDAALKLAGEA